jgi:hypothetical protein
MKQEDMVLQRLISSKYSEIRVVRKPQISEQLPLKPQNTLYFARLVRQPTGLSNKSIDQSRVFKDNTMKKEIKYEVMFDEIWDTSEASIDKDIFYK